MKIYVPLHDSPCTDIKRFQGRLRGSGKQLFEAKG